MYAKRGGVAAYHIVWIGLCLRSVPGVRVLASAVKRCILLVILCKLFNTISASNEKALNYVLSVIITPFRSHIS